jgi:uncharacterized protein (DUF1697 family)
MTTYLALLRGVNVGGHKLVAMADLRDLLTRLGFADARSLLQSGNLVFSSERRRSTAALERTLEQETARRLGVQSDFLVRSAGEWRAAIASNPLPEEAKRDPSHFLVVFLKQTPAANGVATLQRAITGREVVRLNGREAYCAYPDGIGRSRLTHVILEKHLGRGTGRNWNTVLKLAALAETL